jgi:Kef-type K+ transport system membrane component KefB
LPSGSSSAGAAAAQVLRVLQIPGPWMFIGGVLFLGPYLLRFTIRLLCKQDCGLAARQKSNRLAIGLGMMPRGEVGLIFTAIGKSLGVINDALFSAAMLTVIVATLISHPC